MYNFCIISSIVRTHMHDLWFNTYVVFSLFRHYSKPAAPAPMVRTAPPTMSIAELVVGDARFSTLLAAVQAAELVDVLAGEGTFTVFAPTNDAFAKVFGG